MFENIRSKPLAIMLTCVALLQPATLHAASVAVRHTEGLVHGFLLLSTMEGNPLADGDLLQVSRGDRVTNHLVFRFKDGSVRDETAVFSQRGIFRLLSSHLLQKGPTLQYPMEVSIDSSSGQVKIDLARPVRIGHNLSLLPLTSAPRIVLEAGCMTKPAASALLFPCFRAT
jgi:hypothetical protein